MKRLASSVLFLLAACAPVAPAPATAPAPQPAAVTAPTPAAAPASASTAPVHLVVVATTDMHGYFDGRTFPAKGAIGEVHYGGLPVLKSYVNALRAANDDHVLVVDSGDLFQGTLESNLFEGEPVVRGYNDIGYAAAAVGNHEFDYGPAGLLSVPRSPSDDPLGAIKRNASLAQWPFLSANMVEKATRKTPSWAKPSTIVDLAGVKVGIIGLSTPNTPNVTALANVATLDFLDPVAPTVAEAKKLRAAGADAVIVLAHMGGSCPENGDPRDLTKCGRDEEVMDFLAKLPPGTIDAYFGGHTHHSLRNIINGVPAEQAVAYSRLFATMDLWVDGGAHRVVRTEMRPHTMLCTVVFTGTDTCDPLAAPKDVTSLVPRTFEGKRIEPDAELTSLLKPYLDQVAAKRKELTGVELALPFTREFHAESTMGDLLADALRDATGADIAFVNSGSIRTGLRAGRATYGDFYEVSPFDNYPSTVLLTGAQITRILQLTTTGEWGILQVSGIRYTYDEKIGAELPQRQRNRLIDVTLPSGFPPVAAKVYRVAMPDFLAAGGDGLLPVTSELSPDRIQTDFSRTIRDAILDALRRHHQPMVPRKDGRVTVLNEKPKDVQP